MAMVEGYCNSGSDDVESQSDGQLGEFLRTWN